VGHHLVGDVLRAVLFNWKKLKKIRKI
jgi:hypothetical protein